MDEEYLTAEQVAKKLQMHPTIIRRMLAEAKLPGRKLGKSWRVPASELREFMSMKKPPGSVKARRRARAKAGDKKN